MEKLSQQRINACRNEREFCHSCCLFLYPTHTEGEFMVFWGGHWDLYDCQQFLFKWGLYNQKGQLWPRNVNHLKHPHIFLFTGYATTPCAVGCIFADILQYEASYLIFSSRYGKFNSDTRNLSRLSIFHIKNFNQNNISPFFLFFRFCSK